VAEAEAAYLQLYDRHAALMRFITTLGTPMPREFTAAVEYAINSLLRRACSSEELDAERIRNLLKEARASNLTLDKTTIEFLLRKKIDTLAGRFAGDPSNLTKLLDLYKYLTIVKQMPFPVNLWAAQNYVYAIQGRLYPRVRRRAQRGDLKAQAWLDSYVSLSELLSIRLP
jgi:hypothetical protein